MKHTFLLNFVDVWNKEVENLLFDVNENRSIAKTAAILFSVVGGGTFNAWLDYSDCLGVAEELHNFAVGKKTFHSGVNVHPIPIGYDANSIAVYATDSLFPLDGIVNLKKSINPIAFNVVRRFGEKFGDMDNENDFNLKMPIFYAVDKDGVEVRNSRQYIEMICIDNKPYYSGELAQQKILDSIYYMKMDKCVDWDIFCSDVYDSIIKLSALVTGGGDVSGLKLRVNKTDGDYLDFRFALVGEEEITGIFLGN